MVFTCIKLSLWSGRNSIKKGCFRSFSRAANTAESSERRQISFYSLPSSPHFRAMFLSGGATLAKAKPHFIEHLSKHQGGLIDSAHSFQIRPTGWPQERGTAVIADPYFCQLFLWPPDEYLSFNHIRVGRHRASRGFSPTAKLLLCRWQNILTHYKHIASAKPSHLSLFCPTLGRSQMRWLT